MKRELQHFQIGDAYGGSQKWFPTFPMRMGGCGAQTACDSSIVLALHRGLSTLYPYDLTHLTKDDYIRFAYKMKPYLSPRISGIDRLELFVDGYTQFLHDCGEERLLLGQLDGHAPFETAAHAVKEQIDALYPIPMLVLNHKNKALKEYVWHWFLINGYEETDDAMLVKAVTYGGFEWLDLRELWGTGYEKRGGLILFTGGQEA